MADKKDTKIANLRVESTGDAVIADVNAAKPEGPVEITVDPDTLPKAENMPSPFASDRSVPNEQVITEEERRQANEKPGKEDTGRKSNLHKEGKLWFGENAFSYAIVESEYDTGLVDVQTPTGRRQDLPLKTKDNADFINYPYVELGK